VNGDTVQRSVWPSVIGGMVAVVLFDAVGSFASKQLGFAYALLIPGSLVIYGTVAALVAGRRDFVMGLLAALAMAMTDLTLGWTVSWLIGPGRPAGGLTLIAVVGAVMTAFVLAGLTGAIGGWIGIRFLRRSSAPAA
jgi:hypothetical protein